MSTNINCKHYRNGGKCLHPDAPRHLFGRATCLLIDPIPDHRAIQGCNVIIPWERPPVVRL